MRDVIQQDERAWIIKKAEEAQNQRALHLTDRVAEHSSGNPHEYYSNGDYWWPNPDTPDGMPYIQHDGKTNPDNFGYHRYALRATRSAVASLAAGYKITGREEFAQRAVCLLREFFLDENTRMYPHLKYAQAIPGRCTGRGIGIIDTLHLTEIPFAVKALEQSSSMTGEILSGLKEWFSNYLEWMNTHEYGIAERDYVNNHAICWHVQALSYAGFVGNHKIIEECAERYKRVILPSQMRLDGGFDLELRRTKPYGYSIFVLDNLISLVHIADKYGCDLWDFKLPDGRCARAALDFLMPYLLDKSKWFLPSDVEHHDAWPARASFMLFAALKTGDERYLKLYRSLPYESSNDEVRRNLAIRQPILMI